MNDTTRARQRLLIVDDSKVVRVTARKILHDHFETIEAVDGEQAWNILTGEDPFSLVISDLSMPNLDGFGLMERIRKSHLPHIRDLPVIVITGSNDSDAVKERATEAGATDFIGKPFDAIHLMARTQAHASAHNTARSLQEENHALEDESVLDPLTSIANEKAFLEHGYQQLAYAVRHGTRLSVCSIEIDHYGALFKAYGDSVTKNIIQNVATVLTESIRQEDTAARTGTARFALLLPGLHNNGIQHLAERIRKSIKQRVLKHGDMRIHFTISIGLVASEIRRGTRFDDLLSAANRRLAYALAHGGNRVVSAGETARAEQKQPEAVVATVNKAEFLAELESRLADNSIEVEEIDMDLAGVAHIFEARHANVPETSGHRMTGTAVSAADGDAQPGSLATKAMPVEADQATPAPLNVPDLSLLPHNAGPATDFPPQEEHEDAEAIEITAAINPYAGVDHATPRFNPPPRTTPSSFGHTSEEKAANAGGNRPSAETLEIKEVQVSLLERLLTGLRSLFVREEKLE